MLILLIYCDCFWCSYTHIYKNKRGRHSNFVFFIFIIFFCYAAYAQFSVFPPPPFLDVFPMSNCDIYVNFCIGICCISTSYCEINFLAAFKCTLILCETDKFQQGEVFFRFFSSYPFCCVMFLVLRLRLSMRTGKVVVY